MTGRPPWPARGTLEAAGCYPLVAAPVSSREANLANLSVIPGQPPAVARAAGSFTHLNAFDESVGDADARLEHGIRDALKALI